MTNSSITPGRFSRESVFESGLGIPQHDNIQLTYAGENLTGVAYRVGSTTVATLTLAYTGANLTSVTKTVS